MFTISVKITESARLLRLLWSLSQARRDWTSNELATRLGVTTRTIRNDGELVAGRGFSQSLLRFAPGGVLLAG